MEKSDNRASVSKDLKQVRKWILSFGSCSFQDQVLNPLTYPLMHVLYNFLLLQTSEVH